MPRLSERTVCVIGSGLDEHDDLAAEIGELLGRMGVNLLTGGGGGVMRSVSRAFTRTRSDGICIGVIPCSSDADRGVPKQGYPNEFVELPLFTHLPYSGERGQHDLSRNHINVLSASAVVALPGGAGTRSEVALALRYGKPVIAFAHDLASLADFPAAIPRATKVAEVEAFLRR